MKYIDIHSHLAFPEYNEDRKEVLSRMKEMEVATITVGSDLKRSEKAVELANAQENVWATIGIHPGDAGHPEKGIFDEEKFEDLVKNPKVVAIGECGLEYFYKKKEEVGELQKKLFEKQIEFALKHDKPLMLHIREAYNDALDILNEYKKEAGEKLKGDVHFFAGDKETAKKFLDLGFIMSFTGVITFTSDYNEVIKYIPQDSIMAETDAPFVAPVPYRGKRNEPSYVIEVVKKMAEIRGENEQELNKAMTENARRLFGI